LKKLLFLLFAAALFVTGAQIAQAITVTLTTNQVTVTFVITPSPSPVGYVPGSSAALQTIARQPAPSPAYVVPTFDSMLAYTPSQMSDALGPMVVAQATPQSSVKVNFTVKLNPNYQYFHIIPGSTMTMNAGYGTNTYTCVFQVFAHYATAWTVGDYTYGSNTSGGTSGFNGFPTYNYPTTSDLAWLAETITTSYKAYANGGPLGDAAWHGTAGSTNTVCVDLRLSVPATIPAGTYSATLNYYLQHS
jgi:hypothetical protein